MINRDYNITFLFFFIDVSTFTIEKKFCTITVEWIYYFFRILRNAACSSLEDLHICCPIILYMDNHCFSKDYKCPFYS